MKQPLQEKTNPLKPLKQINPISTSGWQVQKKLGANPVAFAKLCRELNKRFGTCAELAEQVGVISATARRWIDLLHRSECVYIVHWIKLHGNNNWIAVWTWNSGGSFSDAPRPKPVSDAESCKRYRERLKRLNQGKSK